MIELIILIAQVADDLFKVFFKIMKETKNPLIILGLGLFLTVLALVSDSKSKKLIQTKIISNSEKEIVEFIQINKNLIGQGNTEKVINNLLQYNFLSQREHIVNEVLIISARYRNELAERRKGLGKNEIVINQVNNSLLEILDQIKNLI